MADASAAEEPEMPAKIMLESTQTMARPPRRCPTRHAANRTRRREMPPCSMTVPARMKNGTASRVKLSIWPTILWGIRIRGIGEAMKMASMLDAPSAKTTGMPVSSRTTKLSTATVNIGRLRRR